MELKHVESKDSIERANREKENARKFAKQIVELAAEQGLNLEEFNRALVDAKHEILRCVFVAETKTINLR